MYVFGIITARDFATLRATHPNTMKGGDIMPFKYDKLFALLKERGISTFKIRRENIISQAALSKMRRGTGNIDTRTLERLYAYLKCQPGDIMEYTEGATSDD